jgi:hypothetical protein
MKRRGAAEKKSIEDGMAVQVKNGVDDWHPLEGASDKFLFI